MLNLLYAGNASAFDGLLISALSTACHTSERLTAYILTMDARERGESFTPLTERHRAFLAEIYSAANKESRVELLDVGDLFRRELGSSPNARTDYTPYCFLRLFADELPLPDKLLYLDTDTLMAGDISPLYATDIAGYELAAVLDHYGRFFMGYHYFNSGVMLLNLPEIRRTGLFRRAVELLCRRRLFLPDQTALNRLTKKKLLLPRRYNEQKRFPDDTVIQHFTKTILWLPYFHTRTIKPWQTERVKTTLTHKYDGVLDEYLAARKAFDGAAGERPTTPGNNAFESEGQTI